jgi:hypothetical protein
MYPLAQALVAIMLVFSFLASAYPINLILLFLQLIHEECMKCVGMQFDYIAAGILIALEISLNKRFVCYVWMNLN